MTTGIVAVLSYVLVSTFTPGPGNISSASLAVLHGYRKTVSFQAGLAAGVFVLMLLSGWLSTSLLRVVPAIEPLLRYAGAAYILYLALGILRASYTFEVDSVRPLGFMNGFILQVLNPKLLVYAFTLFTVFLGSAAGSAARVVVAAILLAATSFCATSTWALCGTAIKSHLHDPRLKAAINIVLALCLAYSAITLLGMA